MAQNNQHEDQGSAYGRFHRRVLEGRGALFAVATAVAISVGGLVEIVPMFSASMGPERLAAVTPYTPLEVAGRDIYIREGCYTCHSQMVRPMRAELLRYGEWSRAWEYTYDRPFLLGSRRLGPDLQRVGGKYPDAWHYDHMEDPRALSPGSIMPSYPWMLDDRVDVADVTASIRALSKLGHPYAGDSDEWVRAEMEAQGSGIVANLQAAGRQSSWDTEIVAMIAYLQRLGTEGRQLLDQADGGSQ
ncbi:MAG TPA: cytochrome-c oxidase, cbb3-type subunit II [Longimicrobiales bacterium]|nr:cytochrome-c oxidase, cbb3-type subunit II [Longimicrobiales bacterium]